MSVPADKAHLISKAMTGMEADNAVRGAKAGAPTPGRTDDDQLVEEGRKSSSQSLHPIQVQDATDRLSPHLQQHSASRLARQCNDGGTIQVGSVPQHTRQTQVGKGGRQ